IAALQTIRFRHPYILQRDLAVLHHLERNLVLDLLDAEPGRRLVLDDEALDLVVGEIARPNDGEVAPWRIAHPTPLPIENPGIGPTLGGPDQPAASARTDQRLGQSETPDLFETRH